MQKITPCLWFDSNAEEAVKFYTSIFKNSKTLSVSHYTPSAEGVTGKKAGTVLTLLFQIEGQEFIALNGGPIFKFNEAISLSVSCETQEEVDALADKLSAVKEVEQCGWLKDKYGVCWQIVPAILPQMMLDKDPKKLSDGSNVFAAADGLANKYGISVCATTG